MASSLEGPVALVAMEMRGLNRFEGEKIKGSRHAFCEIQAEKKVGKNVRK